MTCAVYIRQISEIRGSIKSNRLVVLTTNFTRFVEDPLTNGK